MTNKFNITKACRDALKIMLNSDPAHSIEHVVRVYDWCWKLAKDYPKADLNVLKIAAYWHDVGRTKQSKKKDDHAVKSAEMTEKYFLKQKVNKNFIKSVKTAILNHPSRCKPKTIEGKILHDADKLSFIEGHEQMDILQGFKDGFKTKTYNRRNSVNSLKKLIKRSDGGTSLYQIFILPEAKKIFKQKEKGFIKSVKKVLKIK